MKLKIKLILLILLIIVGTMIYTYGILCENPTIYFRGIVFMMILL